MDVHATLKWFLIAPKREKGEEEEEAISAYAFPSVYFSAYL